MASYIMGWLIPTSDMHVESVVKKKMDIQDVTEA